MHHKPMPHFDEVDVQRFWSNVEQSSPDKCWIWKLSVFTGGYGHFSMSIYSVRRSLRASRVAYFLHYGVDPLEKLVCHQCDNPSCCNPHHLFLGTEKDNIQDAKAKNRLKPRSGASHGSKTHPERIARGERSGASRLKADEVLEIRRLYSEDGCTQQQIADLYGVDRQTIGMIIRARNWQHIADSSLSNPSRRGKPGALNNSAVLNETDVSRIRQLYMTGRVSYASLAIEFNVSKGTIASIIKRRIWQHVP